MKRKNNIKEVRGELKVEEEQERKNNGRMKRQIREKWNSGKQETTEETEERKTKI